LRYELQIALRYLRARRRDAFISVTTVFTAVGVMLGVAALVIMLAVMSGFEANLRERILSLTPEIEIQSSSGAIANYDTIQARLGAIPAIAGTSPYIIGQAMASAAGGVSGVIVRGVEPQNAVVVTQLKRFVRQGSLDSLSNGAAADAAPAPDGVIALGNMLAEKLKVRVGDRVNIVAPLMAPGDAGITTRTGHFIIGAIFQSGIATIDQDFMFMKLDAAQKFFGREGRADAIEVRLKDLDQTVAVTNRLRIALGNSFRVSNWMDFNEALAAGFEFLKRIDALVLLVLIGVAAFNLVATLIMVVMEKRKDIAVLLAMGATPLGVRRIFEFKGLIVGAAGTIAGIVLGALGCFLLAHYHFIHIQAQIYGISTLPVDARPLSFVIVAVASIALCWVATFYPARQAASQMPVEIFRS
jgi:lipoprotein-releasing system permease protein